MLKIFVGMLLRKCNSYNPATFMVFYNAELNIKCLDFCTVQSNREYVYSKRIKCNVEHNV